MFLNNIFVCFAQFFLRSSKKRRAIQALLSAYITLLSQKYFNLLYFSFFLKQLMKMPLLPTRAWLMPDLQLSELYFVLLFHFV